MASIKLKGDTSGEVTIQAPAVAGTTTLNLPATSSTLATQNALGVRNLIINGDMRIDQRGSASTPVTNNYCVDRFKVEENSNGAFTGEQSTDVPTGEGFEYSLKATVTSTDTDLATTQFARIFQVIEGKNIPHLMWGTSNAKTITVSFWVKASVSGTYNFNLQNDDNNRTYMVEYTIDSSNTWEKKTITITGETTGVWKTDNDRGIRVFWSLGTGTTYQTTTGWQIGNYVGTASGTNLLATSGATFYITGIQLEVGTEATPFEHRPYDMELARCQRYYEHNYNIGQTPGSSSSYPANMGSWINGFGTQNGQKGFTSEYKVTKRATPSVTFYDTSGNSGRVSYLDAGGTTFNNQTIAIVFTGTSAILGTMANGTQTGIHYFWVADSEL